VEKPNPPAGRLRAEPVWSLLVILLIGLVGNYLLRWSFPSWPASFTLGLVLVLSGALLITWAASEFSSHKTTLMPSEAASTVVKSGPYRYTRNPIYLSMMLVYSGIALMFDSPLALILILPVIVLLNRQAKREERYLERAFGDQYAEYRKRVPRWL
jgi:protein-S-isoprenylcysteine O-methyltransferase Ste14